MDKLRESNIIGYTVLFLLIAPPLALGIINGNLWVGLLVFAGLVCTLVSLAPLDPWHRADFGRFYGWALPGLATLVAAAYWTRLNPLWLWVPVVAFSLLPLLLAGRIAAAKGEGTLRSVNYALVALLLLGSFAAAIWVERPELVKRFLPLEQAETEVEAQATAVPTVVASRTVPQEEVAGQDSDYVPMQDRPISQRIAPALRLFAHMAIFALLVFLWGRWGVFASVTLGIGILVAYFTWPTFNPLFEQVVYANPADWVEALLRFSAERWGSAGWGLLLLGLLITFLLYPAYRTIVRSQRTLAEYPDKKSLFGETFIQRKLAEAAIKPERVTLAYIANALVGFGLVIIIWVALRRLLPPSLPFSFLPDLARPNLWPPPAHWSYYLVGVLLGGVNLTVARVQRHHKLAAVDTDANAFGYLLGGLLLSLFIPAGALLYLMTLRLSQLLLLPLALAGFQVRKRKRRAVPPPPKPPVSEPRKPRPSPTPNSGKKPSPPRSPAPATPKLASEMVYRSSSSLEDVVPAGDRCFFALTEGGKLFGIKRRAAGPEADLSLASPLGLLHLGGRQLVALDENEILLLDCDGEAIEPGHHFKIDSPIGCFALNPFGTMVAFGRTDGIVQGIFIAAGRAQTFLDGLSVPADLAFSADGRYLAIGDSTGEIHVLDIARRDVDTVITPNASTRPGLEQLCAGPDGTWVVAYKDKHLTCWERATRLHRMRLPSTATAMAVDPDSGRIAYGSRAGYLRIQSADLQQELFKDKVVRGRVNKIIWEDDGCLLVLGNDDTLRQVRP